MTRRSGDASTRSPAVSLSRAKKTQQRQKQLKIIPYCPDAPQRKTSRRNECENSTQTASEAPEDTTVAKAIPPRLERIPSSRSWDPFNALAVLYVSKAERFILNYAYTTSWAVWGDKVTGTNKFAQAWMWRSMESSAAFYSQIVGAAAHYEISRRGTPITSTELADVRLQSKAKAMERLRREISQYHSSSATVSFESLFMAIFTLAVHDNVDLSSPNEAHPLSQLAKLRDMQVYGRVVLGDEHMNAMYRLLEEKGGLSAIDAVAFGNVVPLLDMVYAARKQTAPRLPCFRTLRRLRVPTVWVPDERAGELLGILGSSFREDTGRESSSALPLDDKFRVILGVLAEVTAALDHSQRLGTGVFRDPQIFVGNCDWVSHSLLSVPSYLTSDDGESSKGPKESVIESVIEGTSPISASLDTVLCEICRLGALLYIDMVIYPTPPQAGVKNRLSKKLFPLLQSLEEITLWEEEVAGLVLWAAIMGAIAARYTELQDTYTEYIAQNCMTGSRSWEDIEPRLQSFFWFNAVFDGSAQQIWREAQGIATTPDHV